jgi:hypothetical protein
MRDDLRGRDGRIFSRAKDEDGFAAADRTC